MELRLKNRIDYSKLGSEGPEDRDSPIPPTANGDHGGTIDRPMTIESSPDPIISRTPSETPAAIKPTIPEDVCVGPDNYVWPIRIYKCLKKPDRIALGLSMWEKTQNIATLFSKEDELDDLCEHIPDEANYLILAEGVILNPVGPVLFFAKKVDENLPDEHYEPVVGYYYAYDETLLSWLDIYTAPNSPFPEIEAHEIIRPDGSLAASHAENYKMINAAVNVEMLARPFRAPLKKSLRGQGKATFWRRKDWVMSERHLEVLEKNGITLEDLIYESE